MAQHKSSLIQSAIKILRKKPIDSENKAKKKVVEDPFDIVYQTYQLIGILKTIAHPFCLRMMDCFEDRDFIFICMEHSGGPSLQAYLDGQARVIYNPEVLGKDLIVDEGKIRQIIQKIAQGLEMLHSLGIIMRDF